MSVKIFGDNHEAEVKSFEKIVCLLSLVSAQIVCCVLLIVCCVLCGLVFCVLCRLVSCLGCCNLCLVFCLFD
jgi:hypothetical protein